MASEKQDEKSQSEDPISGILQSFKTSLGSALEGLSGIFGDSLGNTLDHFLGILSFSGIFG